MKNNWIVLRVEDESHILTDTNERAIKELLHDRFQPYTIVNCHDYNDGALLDSLRLDELFS